jgi:hypothetical protein
MILLISYDLKGPYNYTNFYEALKKQGTWWHYLSSTWLISTIKTPVQVFEELRNHISNEDRILITEMGKTYNGWLPKDAWDWIQAQQAIDIVRSILPPLAPPGAYVPQPPSPTSTPNLFNPFLTMPPAKKP